MKRLFGVLIIACLFALLPLGTAVAGESSLKAEVEVQLGIKVTASLPIMYTISSKAQASDEQGRTIPINRYTVSFLIYEGKAGVILPVALSEGQTLASFTDPVSGIEISGNKLTIPVKDSYGNRVMSIVGEIEKVQRENDDTKVVAKNVVLRSAEFSANLTPADKKVSMVSASFELQLKSLLQDASIKTSIIKDPDRDAQKAFELAALDDSTMVADIACALNIEKTNLSNKTNLGQATITIKIGQAWAERYGIDRIKIVRYCEEEEGECQVLLTTFIGYEGEQAIFQAISPDGASIFGLAALVPLPAFHLNWVPIIGGIGGGGTTIGFFIFLFLRRRGGRGISLGKKWPTGLRPEDWRA